MRLLFVVLLFCVGATTVHAQPLKHFELKIPDRVDKLFGEVKADSNFIRYIKLKQATETYAKQYHDSLRQAGQSESAPYIDTTGQHAPYFAHLEQKVNRIVQLKQLLGKQYPLFEQLSYAEQQKLNRLATDYYAKQPAH